MTTTDQTMTSKENPMTTPSTTMSKNDLDMPDAVPPQRPSAARWPLAFRRLPSSVVHSDNAGHRWPTRSWSVALCPILALIALWSSTAPASAQTRYTVTDLGVLTDRNTSTALALNTAGQVVGFCENAGDPYSIKAFIWDSQGGMRYPGDPIGGSNYSAAVSINNSGTAVGYYFNTGTNFRPVMWPTFGQPVVLSTIGGFPYHAAVSINDAGYIAQQNWSYSGPPSRVYLRSPTGNFTDIGTTDGVPNPINGLINNSNQIAALNYGPALPRSDNAFLWDPVSGMTPIMALPGDDTIESQGLNDSGVVVGESWDHPAGLVHPIIWDRLNGTRALQVLDPAHPVGYARAVSNANVAVGSSRNALGVTHACIWDAAGNIADLNSRLADSSAWQYLENAQAINSVGMIVGTGILKNGDTHAFILVPVPCEASTIQTQPQSQAIRAGFPVTFSVSATGSPVYQWRRNGVNIPDATAASFTIAECVPSQAGQYTCVVMSECDSVNSNPATLTVLTLPSCPADFNNDGSASSQDFFDFLAAFFAGC